MSSDIVSTLDLSLSKEFALYSDVHSVDHKTAVDELIDKSGRLQLNTYQSFVRNLFDPTSEYTSLLLIHGTGTGKTITSLAVASEYQKQYREFSIIKKNKNYNDIHSIVIVGYTRDIFKNELISHPEFGFVSTTELAELRELQKSEHESKAVADKINILRNRLYRRISNRQMNGIYSFYGYRQLFNRVINQQDIAKQLKVNQSSDDIDITGLDPVQIRNWIKDGVVRLNRAFVETLRNSLFICDEVHNIYYHKDVNAYGLAIEIINDYFNEPKLYNPTWSATDENCIRWLYLSATPLTYTPTEIVPIINLLNLKPLRVSQSDIFSDRTKDITPQGLSLITQRVDKKISYVMDDNPIQYPSASFTGTSIKGIPYLKFIRCEISKLHESATTQYLLHETIESTEVSNKTNTIKDMVFQSGKDKSKALFRYSDLAEEMRSGVSPYTEDSKGHLFSNLFHLDSLKTYSSKYFHMMKQIIDLKGPEHGKIFTYHPYVQSTGTNLISDIFRANGLLEGDEFPSATSICMTCDKLYRDHQCKKSSDVCEFIGVRFIVVTGYVSKTMTVNRLNQFNSPENSDGKLIKILLGSKAMRESHTLKACRHLMVTHQPTSVSELIQIVGRGVRKHSHALLSPNDRNIKLYLFVSSNRTDDLSLEEADYYEKMRLYIQIQQIERILFDQSIDYLINFRFKRREVPKLIGEAFALDLNLYKKYSTSKAYSLNNLSKVRNNSFYFGQETELCRLIIKRILLEYQPIISKSKLYELVRDPPFQVEADVKLLSNEAIEYALSEIIFNKTDSIIIDSTTKTSQSIESLFDDSKIIVGSNNQQLHIKINSDQMIYIEPINSPIDDMHKLLTIGEVSHTIKQIDLEDLANRWNNLVHIEDIVADLELEFLKTNTIETTITTRLSQFAIETHAKLLEYCIIAIAARVINNKKININPQLIIQLTNYYIDNGIVVTIADTLNTIVGSQYKKYNIFTGLSWQEVLLTSSKQTRVSYCSMPIGHYIKYVPRLLDISSLNNRVVVWNEYSSIVPTVAWKYPQSIIGYEERAKGIDHIFKIRDLADSSSKGINPMFIQTNDLQAIAKRLKIKIDSGSKKQNIVDSIKQFMKTTEAKYRKDKSANKIYFHVYESIPV